jgi:hypothetical protein
MSFDSSSSSSQVTIPAGKYHPFLAAKTFPFEMLTALVIGMVIMYAWGRVHISVDRFENKNILVTKAGALDNQFGQCMSEAGRDVGLYGGCGAAEPFAAKKKLNSNFASGQLVRSRDELHKLMEAGRSGFLNGRGAGPEVQMSAEDVEYWASEVANPGNAGGSLAQAPTPAASSVVPPQAVAAASNFAAGRATNDDLLLLQAHA